MATREKRLAQFDGSGAPPPDQPVEVLCEDHSGTYQLPFACRSSTANGAMTIRRRGRGNGDRLAAAARVKHAEHGLAGRALCSKCDEGARRS